nr:uncharacterized protein LOC110382223 isoform X1 [Helicoverpa armigera]
MNKNQRRVSRRRENSSRTSANKSKGTNDDAHSLYKAKSKDKSAHGHDRCCYVRPERSDFGQSFKNISPDKYRPRPSTAEQHNPRAATPENLMPSAANPEKLMPSAPSPQQLIRIAPSPERFMPSGRSPERFMPSGHSPERFMPSTASPERFMPSAASPDTFMPSAHSPEMFMLGDANPVKLMPSVISREKLIPSAISRQQLMPSAASREKHNHLEPKRRSEQYQTMLEDQYGFDPSIIQLKGLKKLVCDHSTKIDFHLDYADQMTGAAPAYVERASSSQWQTVNSIDDIDRLLIEDDRIPGTRERIPKEIFISEVPRVKIIAEKFSKYKKNNLELRRLDEKVVCVEYDIFDQYEEVLKPMQRMRAFFSIKPVFDDSNNKEGGALPTLSTNIKRKFNILDEDLKKLTDKEIEILDGKIEENHSYLEDLRRILKRKKFTNRKKNKNSLDLQSLYNMARLDGLTSGYDYSEPNFLSKAALQEVKDLILQRCASSIHGIRRSRVKRRKERDSALDIGLVSESIVAELLQEDTKLKV